MKTILFTFLIVASLSCTKNLDDKIEGLYYYPNTCELSGNEFSSKPGYNCLTVEFPENSNKLIFTERDSRKKPFAMDYFVTKVGNKRIIKVDVNKGELAGKLPVFFEIDEDGNFRCVYEGLVGRDGIDVIWNKL